MKKRLSKLVLVLAATVSFSSIVCAEGAATCIEVKDGDSTPTLFVSGIDGEVDSASAVIGTTLCDNVPFGNVTDLDTPISTLVLIDNSQSIPESQREKIKEVVKEIVTSGSEANQYKIATFGEEIEVLCDYTSDDNAAVAAVDSVETADRDTYIKDIIYDVVSDPNIFSDIQDSYGRIIVISDGVDDNTLGVTSTELLERIGEMRIPITAIGVQNSNNSNDDKLEEFFSFARRSNGHSYVLNGMDEFSQIVDSLNQDEAIKYFTVNVPESLLDGSKKTIQLTVSQGENDTNVSIDNVRVAQEAEKIQEAQKVEEKESPKETEEAKPIFTIGDFEVMLWMLIVAVVAVIVLIVLIVLLIFNAKKKSEANVIQEINIPVPEFVPPVREQAPQQPVVNNIVNTNTQEDIGEKTLYLFGGNEQQPVTSQTPVVNQVQLPTDNYVLLTNRENGKQYRMLIAENKPVVIGRKAGKANIVVDTDPAISSAHCQISLAGGKFYLTDLNSSNGTFLNNSRVTSVVEIWDGNVIKLGRPEMIVNFIEE